MLAGISIELLIDASLVYFHLTPQQIVQRETPRPLQKLPVKIAVLLDILDATPDSQRQSVIATAQSPQFHVRLLDARLPKLHNWADPVAMALRHRIVTQLPTPRRLIVADRFTQPDDQTTTSAIPVKRGVFIETTLSDGRWVLFTSDLEPLTVEQVASEVSGTSFLVRLTLTMLLCLLLSALAARRLAAPISDLATAAEQLGGSGDAPPVPPRGPTEVQGAILAFNRMRERMRRFNADRTRMIAAMSHDLRTPLTRLRLRAELVENTDQQNKMLAELDMMNGMIDSILSFARDDTKGEPKSLVDLSALVEGICEDASDAGEPVTFSGSRGVTISCRPNALRRAISNLVDNAVKYGRSASVGLALDAEHIVITVEDEGPGIPRNERERVFEPFYRIESSRDPGTGGVGLGLSVTRSIIWEHGGEIVLANRKGGGLSIRLELPAPSQPALSAEVEACSSERRRETRAGADTA
jgi:signal transduction histidine kinase